MIINKYLIFRTDRIGDFLVSAILIKSIKKNDPTAHITLVASEKNYSYIKTFPYVDNVLKLENNFISKLKILFYLNKLKYKYIIIHDNKKRSKIVSLFLRAENKIYIQNLEISHIDIIKNILKKMDFQYFDETLNTLEHLKKNKSNDSNLIQLHFDEKWIYEDYIKKFVHIEPSAIELISFIKKLISKSDNKLIITTGYTLPLIINKIKPNLDELKIKIYENLDFSQLERITSKSGILISCHGAISHVAAANNIKQIDIIDMSYNYSKWTKHFRNYNFVYRENFNLLNTKILKML